MVSSTLRGGILKGMMKKCGNVAIAPSLPKISPGNPLMVIKVILQLHIIEERNVRISPELEKKRCLRVSLKSHPFEILTSCRLWLAGWHRRMFRKLSQDGHDVEIR